MRTLNKANAADAKSRAADQQRSANKEYEMNNNAQNWISLVASVITILIFITGIKSLPAFFENVSNISTEGLLASEIDRSLSIGLLILSQVAYYISYFYILRFFEPHIPRGNLWAPFTRHPFKVPRDFFFFLIFFSFGISISFIFLETFWGKTDIIISKGSVTSSAVFGIISVLGNALTTWVGLDCKN